MPVTADPLYRLMRKVLLITRFYTQGSKDRGSPFWRLTLWGCTEQMGWVCNRHAFEVLECSVANLENKEVKPRILRKELVIVLELCLMLQELEFILTVSSFV